MTWKALNKATTVYWGVADIDDAHGRVLGRGGRPLNPVRDVGGDCKTATIADKVIALFRRVEVTVEQRLERPQ